MRFHFPRRMEGWESQLEKAKSSLIPYFGFFWAIFCVGKDSEDIKKDPTDFEVAGLLGDINSPFLIFVFIANLHKVLIVKFSRLLYFSELFTRIVRTNENPSRATSTSANEKQKFPSRNDRWSQKGMCEARKGKRWWCTCQSIVVI